MAKQNEHGKIIAAAATSVLKPVGCVRRGQSRRWYSDERYWMIQIEFQPSSWSKGSYLNVGASWLWYDQSFASFDLGYRVAPFVPFENVQQFTVAANEMALDAVREVERLREELRTIANISQRLLSLATRPGWPTYHAAVAVG